MAESNDNKLDEDELKSLEGRVDDLIRMVSQLKDENDTLRGRREELLKEHTQLVEKNRMARTRLESIIERLKTIEGK